MSSSVTPKTARKCCVKLEVSSRDLRPCPGGVFPLDSIAGWVGGNPKENFNFYDFLPESRYCIKPRNTSSRHMFSNRVWYAAVYC